MANLTKRDIVVKISNETGMVQHQVFEVVQRTLDMITDSLARGEDVELRNFGIFEVRLTKERVGRNPNQPGSSFKIPPRATVKFKAGKIMRQKVSKLSAELKQAEAVKASAFYPPGEPAPGARSRPSRFKATQDLRVQQPNTEGRVLT
jgi:nucleoid DNA-binding protein